MPAQKREKEDYKENNAWTRVDMEFLFGCLTT